MARRLYTNNAYATLSEVIGPSNTLIRLTGNGVGNFPTPGVNDLVFLTLQGPDDAIEIVQMTDRTGNDCTVVRAQEGTLAQSFSVGSLVELRITADALNHFGQIDNDELVHGNWTFQNHVAVPQNPTDAAHATTKSYVDALVAENVSQATLVDNTDGTYTYTFPDGVATQDIDTNKAYVALTDVDPTGLVDGDVFVWVAANQKFERTPLVSVFADFEARISALEGP